MSNSHPLIQALERLASAQGSRFEYVIRPVGEALSVTAGADDLTIELFTKSSRGAVGRLMNKLFAYRYSAIIQNQDQPAAQIRVNFHAHDERGHPVRYLTAQRTIDWITLEAVKRRLVSADALGVGRRNINRTASWPKLRLQYKF